MTSTISWLDTSADEQRRVRELIALFSESGTLDELGVGQIRDAFSDALFPGTSTIQTRARYFLMVPWSYLTAAHPGRTGESLRQHADHSQRVAIEALRGMHDKQLGVIGALAGAQVKTLPSAIYWNGLLTFNILRRNVAPEQLSNARPESDAADELATRATEDWHPTIPGAPEGFPKNIEGGLDLAPAEAEWLAERILKSVPGTLLAHLVGAERAPDEASKYPWWDSMAASASGSAATVLRHAHLFSLAMKGATRLYGVLVAEAYENAGYNTVVAPVEKHREEYCAWVREVEDERHLIETFDQHDFWLFVRGQNENVSQLTERFVRSWVDGLLDGSAARALDDGAVARQLVTERERSIKRSQARLSNTKLLGLWGGGIADGLSFRWPTVKTLVSDIHEGLARA